MHRVFIDGKAPGNGKITVSGEDAVHIGRSLRMRVGENLLASIDGVTYPTVITGFTKDTVELEINGEKMPSVEPPGERILFQALVKGDSADEIVSRAVETGITSVVFFTSSCCIAKAGDGFENRLGRLRKIAKESAMQSGRDRVPDIDGCIDFEELLKKIQGYPLTLFCYEGEGTVPVKKALEKASAENIAIIIGPEGGFTPDEAKRIAGAGGIPVGLGKRILRAKTAPAVAASCIMCMTEMN